MRRTVPHGVWAVKRVARAKRIAPMTVLHRAGSARVRANHLGDQVLTTLLSLRLLWRVLVG